MSHVYVAVAMERGDKTTEACDSLQCSRQNLAYMVKKEQIDPIKEDVKGNLYLKGDVLAAAY